MLYVAISRPRKTSWRAANEIFVAMTSEGVGPGVKMELNSSVRNIDMLGKEETGSATFKSLGLLVAQSKMIEEQASTFEKRTRWEISQQKDLDAGQRRK